MSYWEDLDDHLGRLEPNDLNLDYMGVSHLDCVSRVLFNVSLGFWLWWVLSSPLTIKVN